MRNTLGGYTLLEVMIFLAVSGLLLVAAITAVGGQAGHTEFRNSMNDINTKMQLWVDQVVNGYTSSTSTAAAPSFQCTAPASGPPLLSLSSGKERGANPQCIFLGKAIHVNTTEAYSDKIYAYQIIGRRTQTVSGQTVIVNGLPAASPIAAIDTVNLTEVYKIPYGTRIVWASSGATQSKMVGIYSNFNTESALVGENGALSLMAVQYPLATDVAPEQSDVKNCIRMSAPCNPSGSAANPWPMQQWRVCFGSTRNSDRSLLTLTSNQGVGISTKLTHDGC